MFNFSLKEIKQIVGKEKNLPLVIPLYKEIVVDTETPVSLFLKLASKEKYAYLLESAEANLRWGRYSFISYEPYILFSYTDKKLYLTKNGKQKIFVNVSLFDKLRTLLNQYKLPKNLKNDLPRFFGGFVGYLSWEIVSFIEKKVKIPKNNEFKDIPLVFLMFNKIVLIYDHYLNKLKIVNLLLVEDRKVNIENLYNEAVGKINDVISTINSTVSITKELDFNLSFNKKILGEYKPLKQKNEFVNIVKKAKEYVLSGDIIQVVLSNRWKKFTTASPFDIYRALRTINPSPYMFYLKFGDLILIGSSPEILVRKEKDVVETRPIAGTRPRGLTEEEDNRYEKDLVSSEKENAEHIMLVDLARNDIGKVSKIGSITLPEFKIIEKFSHVMHLVTSVKGVLEEKYDCIDVLKSTFPAGTVSGAPKVRAMQIISELEDTTRGPYAGSVGYFSLTGDMDMAITIRTIVYNNKNVYIQTGAGIVADSVPQKEYEETINKAKALFLAVKIAEQ
jgi:anthranilate synthase component 1